VRLAFHHIDKCAGTTLLAFLENRHASNRRLLVEQFGDARTLNIWKIPAELLQRATFIHDPFGTANWKTHLGNVSSFAVFREPIARLVSDWAMFCAWTDNEVEHSDELKRVRSISREGLRSYLLSPEPMIVGKRWNHMATHMILGEPALRRGCETRQFLFDRALVRAIEATALVNLRDLDIVGLVEEFPATLQALCLHFGWPIPDEVQTLNERRTGEMLEGLDEETLSLARSCTEVDRVLYDAAWEKFRAQTAQLADRFGPDLHKASWDLHRHRLADPPAWVSLGMDEPIPGTGWQAREINGYKQSCWIGPSPNANLQVRVDKSQGLRIRLRCTGFMDIGQLQQFSISMDGRSCTVRFHKDESNVHHVEGTIAAAELDQADAILAIDLSCGFVRRPPNESDPRSLGVEISGIEISSIKIGAP
jgi:hypothetical protein